VRFRPSSFLSSPVSNQFLPRRSICLWQITKKKPVFTKSLAHGINEYPSESEGIIGTPRYITALSCLPYGDTFASGSWDGEIRIWKIDERLRSFHQLTTISAPGFVNSLQLIAPSLHEAPREMKLPPGASKKQKGEEKKKAEKALIVVAATSKEPRLGRWMRFKEAKDGALVAVIPMQ
jgi:ribosomal RNA-processing protein 9